jgi:hypothetical protein
VDITLTASDAQNEALTYSIVTFPAHGSLTGIAPNISYTPATDYSGPDSFTFTANDGLLESNSAAVSITVMPVNDAPVASPDAHTTRLNTALITDTPGVLGNDADLDGDLLTAVLVSGPLHGALTLNANGSFTYTPSTDTAARQLQLPGERRCFNVQCDDGFLVISGPTGPIVSLSRQASASAIR